MSFMGLCIFSAVSFAVLMGAFKGLSFFFQRRIKKGYQPELSTFLFGAAGLFALTFLVALGVVFYPFANSVSTQIMGVTALAFGTLLLTEQIVPNVRLRYILLFLFCLGGTMFIPTDAAMWQFPFSPALCAGLAVIWMLFMLLMRTMDRVMLLGFLTLSALVVGVALLSSSAFPFFPDAFNFTFLLMLFLLLGLAYYLKNNGCYILGQPAIFFISYLVGFMGMVMIARGEGIYAPIFIAYELFEIIMAMGVNFWLYKRFVPIQTPFMVEQALMKNIAPTKVLRKVFLWCVLFPLLGVVSLFAEGDYLLAIYGFVGILWISIYLNLKDWGKPKVRFRDLFSDIKKGWNTMKEEIKNPPLKQQKTAPKKNKKRKK